MKSHLNYPSTLGLIVILSLASCTKSDSTVKTPLVRAVEYTYADSNLVSNYYFKKGTYWIYQDSVRGQIDSFNVDSSANKEYKYTIDGMHQSRPAATSYFVSYISQRNINGSGRPKVLKCKLSITQDVVQFYYYDTLTLRPEAFYQYPLFYSNTDTSSDNSPYTFNGTTYYALISVHDSIGYEPPADDRYLFCKHVGIVKMHINHTDQNHVWELKRAHIVQ